MYRLPLWVISILVASCASVSAQIFIGTLNGAAEVPPNASPGTGSATVTLNVPAKTMKVEVNFSGLVAANTAAHIHCCIAPPGTASVATVTPTFTGFPAGVTSGTYTQTFDMTLASSFNPSFVSANGSTAASAFTALLNGIGAGQAYLNIHSSTFPGGEIRSFLVEQSIFRNGFEAVVARAARMPHR